MLQNLEMLLEKHKILSLLAGKALVEVRKKVYQQNLIQVQSKNFYYNYKLVFHFLEDYRSRLVVFEYFKYF